MNERQIAHIDLDTFFVSCERLLNSSLNGKPIIIGGTGDRGVVASCSYEARYFGVRSAMPVQYALRLCPDAKVIRGDMELYSRKSKEVTGIIAEQAPVLEKASVDEFYMDVSGMDKFFGTFKWVGELTDKVKKESGLPLSFGLSTNKTVAKMATSEAKPLGNLYIQEPEVKPFLNPLSIMKIPMIGNATYQILSRIGVRKIATLSEMPMEFLIKLLGKNGKSLWDKANGIDQTPVQPYHESKSHSAERTFHQDTMDIKELRTKLIQLVERVAFEIRNENKLCSVLTVKIRYTNFDTHTKQINMPYTCADHVLIQNALQLFNQLYQRRMRLRLIGVRLSGLVYGNYQTRLFDDNEHLLNLYQSIDFVRHKYGSKIIQRGSTLPILKSK